MNKAGKRSVIIICLVILVIVVSVINLKAFAMSANIRSAGTKLKVFIGSSRSTNPVASELYQTARRDYLADLAKSVTDQKYDAVCVFNDYYSVQAVTELYMESITVKRVYFWEPHETGRVSLSVENNDINGAINRLYKTALDDMGTEAFDDADRAIIKMIEDNSYGIFSITIEASAEVLNDLSNREMFKFIDVKYSEEAEKKASGSDVTLEYIELPFKPDGAL